MKVAVVGSGVSGLAATWALNEHSEHEVHLFESDSRPGGHANTVPFGPLKTKVDTGFIVFNTVTYPNFLAFIKHMDLPYIASEMSFAVTRDRGAYEWAGTSLGALFAQGRNWVNPSQWRMVWDILRFNTECLNVLEPGAKPESIGQYLARHGYSDSFRDNYLLPMTAAIWSTPPDTAALDFPVQTLIRFMHNHHLLQILDRPTWLTLKNGSHEYVKAILKKVPKHRYHLSSPVERVEQRGDKVWVTVKDGEAIDFDHVIMACHADTTLSILGVTATEKEKAVLGEFQFSQNRAVLHSDTQLMPRRRKTWSAWNYLTTSDGESANVNSVALTYWMNLLQSIPEKEHGPILVTLNPPFEPKPDLLLGEWDYSHPQFSERSVKAQAKLDSIQNKRGITFCGAWTKYGFHEDGFKSGLSTAVNHLGATPPFAVQSAERAHSPSSSSSPLSSDRLLVLFFKMAEWIRTTWVVSLSWSIVMLWGIVLCWALEMFVYREQDEMRTDIEFVRGQLWASTGSRSRKSLGRARGQKKMQ